MSQNIQNATYNNIPEENQSMLRAMLTDAIFGADLLGINDFYWELHETDLDTGEDAYRAGYTVGEARTWVNSLTYIKWAQEYDATHASHPEKDYHGQIKFVVGLRGEKADVLAKAEALLAICFNSYYKNIVAFCDKDWTTHYVDTPKEAE